MNFSGDKWCVSWMMISLMCDDESFELFYDDMMFRWCAYDVVLICLWYCDDNMICDVCSLA